MTLIRFIESILNAIGRLFASLFGSIPKPKPRKPKDPDEPTPPRVGKSWYKLALNERGVREIAGEKHDPTVLQYYADAGHPQIDDDETAWCAAFVGAMLQRSGISGSKSLAARSYLQWGKKLSKPKPGCVVVFWRNSPRSWQGHVGFYVKEDDKYIYTLGGNQRNAVNISKYPKSKLLGYRWPVTPSNSRTYRAAGLGLLGAGTTATAVLESQTEVMGIAKQLQFVAPPDLAVIGNIATIAALALIIWARWSDNKDKGR
jgi:uncharacterized protein (TIGR02594 family)